MRRLRSFVFLTAVVVALCVAALPTHAASTTRLTSDVVHDLSLAQSLGAVPSSRQIAVGVALKNPNEAAENSYLANSSFRRCQSRSGTSARPAPRHQ
jgi:hypothetical protein